MQVDKVVQELTLVTLMIFIIVVLCVTGTSDSVENIGLEQTPLEDKIVLEVTKPLAISCTLDRETMHENYPGRNSSDLVFFHNTELVDPKYLGIVDEATIFLLMQNLPASKSTFYCKLKLDKTSSNEDAYQDVHITEVTIGYKPQKPKNISCISYNWDYLTCSWDPLDNPVPTKFDLNFSGSRTTREYLCQLEKPPSFNKCVLGRSEKDKHSYRLSGFGYYRRYLRIYYITLKASNALGTENFNYTFQHYKHVIPAKPNKFSVMSRTFSSVSLTWEIPDSLKWFPPGLDQKITYQSEWDGRENWTVIIIGKDESEDLQRYYNLTGLYANTAYDVRVYIRSNATNDENMWSDFSDVTFSTLPTVTDPAPRTNIGSFEIIKNNVGRDVYLYWRALPPYVRNGNNFTFKHFTEALVPSQFTQNYALFSGLTYDSYNLEMTSINEIGANSNRTRVFIPSQSEIPEEPKYFMNVDFGNGLYVLSWEPPMESKDIVGYTIFWCENERRLSHQCTGYLNWTPVSKNMTTYNVSVPNAHSNYQFAISANTEGASSGMMWTTCTVIDTNDNGLLKSVWVSGIGSTFTEISWTLDCSERRGIIQGLNIYYCEISFIDSTCKGPELKTTVTPDSRNTRAIVDNLKPYTKYRFAVTMFTVKGESLRSKYVYSTNLEAAPTSPRNLRFSRVTNTSINISWNIPEAMNGIFRYYVIYCNDRMEKVGAESFVLQDLLPYRNYGIRVAACTVSCSLPSQPIYVTTDIGVPGKIHIIQIRFLNSDRALVTWEAPGNSAGLLDYYEIQLNDGGVNRSDSTAMTLPFPDCVIIEQNEVYQYRVRAVNIAPNNVHLKGPWSETGQGYCYSSKPSQIVSIAVWIIVGLCIHLVLLFFAYTIRMKISYQTKLDEVMLQIPSRK